ncbi:oxygen-binding di-iron domain-containing protein [Hippea jasoniae]|uniref:diguanylate cyclase n=1 Tax=Hippea jasoniae TaxID=944479 RepID=UPI00054DAE70|nr:diguanylate cyclase [Hippea jasoniae]
MSVKIDYKNPVEIGDDVFWVGSYIPDDQFQCHVYLIRNKDESILIDPGSLITFDQTKRKIEQLIKLEDIKYFICHHQDPDIVASLSEFFKVIEPHNRYVVTHWRAWALLKHYNWHVNLYEIEENNWQLLAGDRLLKFIFTPYMHFAGAFCSLDVKTKILFSSDIFGAFTNGFELFAKDSDDYFTKLRAFHEHYMPAREIVNSGLDNIEKHKPFELIAPQHGSIIKKELIDSIIEKLRGLSCGLFRRFSTTKDVEKLMLINDALDRIIKVIAYNEDFFDILELFRSMLKDYYHIETVKIAVKCPNRDSVVSLDLDKKRVASIMSTPEEINSFLESLKTIKEREVLDKDSFVHKIFGLSASKPVYQFKIFDKSQNCLGVCGVVFDSPIEKIRQDFDILKQFEMPISMLVLRETKRLEIEEINKDLYAASITDELTGLYNKRYFNIFMRHEFKRCLRFNIPLSLVFFDIDNFKSINDRYGHVAGDVVLNRVAGIIKASIRSVDLAVRFGGEEFVVVLLNTPKKDGAKIAERIREKIEQEIFSVDDTNIKCTISGGVADIKEIEEDNYIRLVDLADSRLYKAKNSGKNRIVEN